MHVDVTQWKYETKVANWTINREMEDSQQRDNVSQLVDWSSAEFRADCIVCRLHQVAFRSS